MSVLYSTFEISLQSLERGAQGARAAYMHSLFALANTEERSLSAYISINPSIDSRSIVAAGLARLLELEGGTFDDHNFSIDAFKVFDSVFGKLYVERQLGVRDQTHLRRQAILDEIELLKPLSIYLGAELSRQQISDARGAVEKFFRSLGARLFVLPLMPVELRERGRVLEIFQTLDQLLSSHERSLEDIDNVREVRAKYEVLIAEANCSYYDSLVHPLIESLFLKFDDLIAQDPTFQPTSLVLSFPNRRYQLDTPNVPVYIQATVHNSGPGRALDVVVTYEISISDFGRRSISVGTVNRGTSVFDLPEIVERTGEEAIATAFVEWSDIDGRHSSPEQIVELASQRGDVDWAALRYSDPYTTEPVDSIGELVGRSAQLDLMKTKFLGRVMPSYFITGQKRVGKTSLAKTLCQSLHEAGAGKDISTIYLEGGDYIAADGNQTIRRLCEAIKQSVLNRFPGISFALSPHFGDSLSDLKTLFDQLWVVRPEARFMIALDEFDELPFELFARGAMSRSVFLALRGLSGKNQLGFAIIGSEKMALILNEQGEHLNKWDNVSLDYFDKNTQWTDYNELITRPAQDKVEFSEGAISSLYDLTAGHPFFTKLLCRRILDDACDRRISYIDEAMVTRAATLLCDTEEVNRFQHFWEDGIFATVDAQVDIVERRKRLLLAAADLLRNARSLTAAALSDHKLMHGRGAGVSAELQSLERRNILTFGRGMYEFKIPLFKQWLMGVGAGKVLMELPTSEEVVGLRFEQAARVSHEEIVFLCDKWTYRWKKVTPQDVRSWLELFGNVENQRLMFSLLKGIKFYPGDVYSIKLQEAYRSLAHRYVRFRGERELKRGDILVSYLDGAGKSGSQLAKVFASQNRIYAGCVIEQAKLVERLESEKDLQAIVCVDDFVGSGRTAATGLRKMWTSIGAIVEERGIGFHIIAIAGFSSAVQQLQDTAAGLSTKIFVDVLDHLTDQDRAFSAESLVFGSDSERLRAKDIAFNIGKTLVPATPLGHNPGEALVVFDTNCPNNSLPILWSNANGWKPLFERY